MIDKIIRKIVKKRLEKEREYYQYQLISIDTELGCAGYLSDQDVNKLMKCRNESKEKHDHLDYVINMIKC